jgi:hypothetical protein
VAKKENIIAQIPMRINLKGYIAGHKWILLLPVSSERTLIIQKTANIAQVNTARSVYI